MNIRNTNQTLFPILAAYTHIPTLVCLLNEYFSYYQTQRNKTKKVVPTAVDVCFVLSDGGVFDRGSGGVCVGWSNQAEPQMSDVSHPQFLLFLLLSSLISSFH